MERALASLTAAVAGAPDLDGAVQALLDQLAGGLGFAHSMLYLIDDERRVLVAISTRGYLGGTGAELKLDEGLFGVVVARRCAVRFGSAMERRYGKAAR